eukprot:1062038-Alexandrium_andersonii.AAC.1
MLINAQHQDGRNGLLRDVLVERLRCKCFQTSTFQQHECMLYGTQPVKGGQARKLGVLPGLLLDGLALAIARRQQEGGDLLVAGRALRRGHDHAARALAQASVPHHLAEKSAYKKQINA